MTIDELAHRAGTTSRNIRALQTKGILRPPKLVGRTGSYGEDHLQRLLAVIRLQARGFGLAGIRELLDAWETGATLDEVLGLRPEPHRRRHEQPDVFDELATSINTLARLAPLALVPGPMADGFSMFN